MQRLTSWAGHDHTEPYGITKSDQGADMNSINEQVAIVTGADREELTSIITKGELPTSAGWPSCISSAAYAGWSWLTKPK